MCLLRLFNSIYCLSILLYKRRSTGRARGYATSFPSTPQIYGIFPGILEYKLGELISRVLSRGRSVRPRPSEAWSLAIHLKQQVTDFNQGWQKKLLVKTDSRRYQELGGATQSVWEPVSTRSALNVYYLPHSCLWWQERNLATVHARFIGRLCLFDTQSTEKNEPF